MKSIWQLQEAKNQLSLVVEHALTKGPQTITRHGEPVVVVVAAKDFVRPRRKRKSILELFEPVRGTNLKIERLRDFPREVKL